VEIFPNHFEARAMKTTFPKFLLAGAFALASGISAANVVEIIGNGTAGDLLPPPGDYTVQCSVEDCYGLTGLTNPATWDEDGSPYQAQVYSTANSDVATELALLNTLLGNSGENLIEGATKYNIALQSFTTDAEYFSIKQGSWIVYFWNDTGEDLKVNFLLNGKSATFSHYTEYGGGGGVNEIPLPGAVWLFGSALLGFVSWSRRRAA
jgi:hypothetical protein